MAHPGDHDWHPPAPPEDPEQMELLKFRGLVDTSFDPNEDEWIGRPRDPSSEAHKDQVRVKKLQHSVGISLGKLQKELDRNLGYSDAWSHRVADRERKKSPDTRGQMIDLR